MGAIDDWLATSVLVPTAGLTVASFVSPPASSFGESPGSVGAGRPGPKAGTVENVWPFDTVSAVSEQAGVVTLLTLILRRGSSLGKWRRT